MTFKRGTINIGLRETIRHSSSMISHRMGGPVVWYVLDRDVIAEEQDWADIRHDDKNRNK